MVKKRGLNDMATVEEGIVIESLETTDVSKTEETNENTLPVEEDSEYAKLLGAAQEIRRRAEVLGYILKGDSKATVDLNDSAKIIDFAMLSSQAFESSEAIATAFQLGATENILVEGKDLNVLCIDFGPNKISIFIQKEADNADLLKTFAPQA